MITNEYLYYYNIFSAKKAQKLKYYFEISYGLFFSSLLGCFPAIISTDRKSFNKDSKISSAFPTPTTHLHGPKLLQTTLGMNLHHDIFSPFEIPPSLDTLGGPEGASHSA